MVKIGRKPEKYEDQHAGYGYGVRKTEKKRILEFCAAINMELT